MEEGTWKDLLAYDEPKGFKPPHWCAVLIEVTVFLLFGIGAVLLRFTDWAPVYRRQDIPLLCWDLSFFQSALSDDYTYIYYTICTVLPFLMIILCEFERSYFCVNPNYKLFTGVQRFFYISLRPLGMFILGIFLVSVITDYIKVQISWPRPYFFEQHGEFCRNTSIINGTLSMEERFGLTSFPCHLSSISAFAAFLATCYTNNSVSLNSAPLIKPAIAASLFLVTVAGSIYRVEIHYNHWIDVFCGLAIGSFMAYIINLILLQSHKLHSKIVSDSAWKLLLPRVALPRTVLPTENTQYLSGNIATVKTIHSHRSQQSKGSRPPSRNMN